MKRAPRTSRRALSPFAPADLTPMVDVVFLLIVFFILVSQLTRTERTPIALPELPGELLSPSPARERVVVHVEDDAMRIGTARVAHGPDARRDLADLLRNVLASAPDAPVVLRAPREAPYARVATALTAIRDAGCADVRLIAKETLR